MFKINLSKERSKIITKAAGKSSTINPTKTGKMLNSILKKGAAGKSGKSKYINTNESADKIAMVESRRVFVITGSSNFL